MTTMVKTDRFEKLTLLLVEPSALQRRIIVGECTEIGASNVDVVGSLADALDWLQGCRADVVISALYLPDGTGTELVERMRRDPRWVDVPFVLISSETRPQALEPVRQSGACGILPKPFTASQLARALSRTLEMPESLDMEDVDVESLRVLLVDDSPNSRRFIRRVLESLGLRHFMEAGNGKEAVVMLAETLVDLIITDYNMPEMDGREFVEYVRTRSWQQSVPILMVTSESNTSRLAAVEEAGVSGICDKPFDTTVLQQLLAGILRQRED
ncbi:response regulator [Zoogloea sp.]|uniref:response regulator transcription factor n=1 Tax=Zoogloea sp. TaxID=49181 RepID=UPI0031FDCF9D